HWLDGLTAIVDRRQEIRLRNPLTPLGFSPHYATSAPFPSTIAALAALRRARPGPWYREKVRRDNALAVPRDESNPSRPASTVPPRRPLFWHTFPFPSTAYNAARHGWPHRR